MPDRIVRTIVVAQVSLIDLNAEIAERSQYKREQEAIIAQIINDGNNNLLSLNYQIEAAKKQVKEYKAKLYDLAREKYEAEEDLKNLRRDIQEELKSSGFNPSFGV